MPWYTHIDAVNRPELLNEWSDSVVEGYEEVCKFVSKLIVKYVTCRKKPYIIAFDGYLGAQWECFVKRITELLKEQSLKAEKVNTNILFKSPDWIEKYSRPYLTNDASFGIVCRIKSIV